MKTEVEIRKRLAAYSERKYQARQRLKAAGSEDWEAAMTERSRCEGYIDALNWMLRVECNHCGRAIRTTESTKCGWTHVSIDKDNCNHPCPKPGEA